MTLPCYYLPPISWFAAVKGGEPISIEVCDNFQKQTMRNRCCIDSPNGRLTLSIPIDKSNFSSLGKCHMRDVIISNQLDWRHQHWYAFESSYYNSPFFEYLQDDFRPIYQRQWKYLADLNQQLITTCLSLLELDCTVSRTTVYQGNTMPTTPENTREYYQVFKEKHGFIDNLSIIDLLFNLGPEAQLFI